MRSVAHKKLVHYYKTHYRVYHPCRGMDLHDFCRRFVRGQLINNTLRLAIYQAPEAANSQHAVECQRRLRPTPYRGEQNGLLCFVKFIVVGHFISINIYKLFS